MSVRNYLEQTFNRTFDRCGDQAPCGGRSRCISVCLTEEEVRTYFFFSLVRDPIERFYSGYAEASFWDGPRAYPHSREGMQAQLRRLAKHKQCKENNHLASQVNHLAGAHRGPRPAPVKVLASL